MTEPLNQFDLRCWNQRRNTLLLDIDIFGNYHRCNTGAGECPDYVANSLFLHKLYLKKMVLLNLVCLGYDTLLTNSLTTV